MKQRLQTDKYTIAWFKLAECIARGEKERALGVYRLLAHSFDDDAFAYQLAGDILISFGDMARGFEKYHAAIDLYKKQGRILQAAAVCEHIITLDPNALSYHKNLIEFYISMEIQSKAIAHIQLFFDDVIRLNAWDEISVILPYLTHMQDHKAVYNVYEHMIHTVCKKKITPAIVYPMVDSILSNALLIGYVHGMQQLLSSMQALDQHLYMHACSFLAQQDPTK